MLSVYARRWTCVAVHTSRQARQTSGSAGRRYLPCFIGMRFGSHRRSDSLLRLMKFLQRRARRIEFSLYGTQYKRPETPVETRFKGFPFRSVDSLLYKYSGYTSASWIQGNLKVDSSMAGKKVTQGAAPEEIAWKIPAPLRAAAELCSHDMKARASCDRNIVDSTDY